jgi:hypothetical protein
VVPPFNPRVYQEMFARVLLRQNAGSRFVQPLIAAIASAMQLRVWRGDELSC